MMAGMIRFDRPMWMLVAAIGGVLVVASIFALIIRTRAKDLPARRNAANLSARIRAWWVIVVLLCGSLLLGQTVVIVLFACISFLALREMLTLTATRRADQHTMFWAFFVMVPIQYVAVGIGWYGFYSIFIPVYGFLFLAIRSTLTGDTMRYLERVAKIQWGTFVCVYCISYAPALLTIQLIPGSPPAWKLLIFLLVVVEGSDVLQYIWGCTIGAHKISPKVSPNKTWEGFIGGVLSAAALGAAVHWLTPFSRGQAFGIALIIAIVGFLGGIVLSAVKRDAKVKDWGHLIAGHGGVMDRVDSLSFAAPVFFHVVRYWFT